MHSRSPAYCMRPNNRAGPTTGLHNLQDFARKARCKSVQLMPTPTSPAPSPANSTLTVTFLMMGARQGLRCCGQVVWFHDTRDFLAILIFANYILIEIQSDATVCRYLFTAKLLYMFRVSQHPSSGVLKTVTAASGTGHNTGTATSL